jgi:dolichyl-phosphate beta-glucosyltransferase
MRFHLGYSETQCGFKLFRKDLAKALAKHQIIDGFAFDVEYLYFCHLNGFDIQEVPCEWNDGEKSTIEKAAKTSMNFVGDMKRIKKNKKNYILTLEEKESLKRKEA